MPKILWVGDAVVHSGFSRVTHAILDRLHATWDVAVLGIVWNGDPHPYPYRIYTTALPEFGVWSPFGDKKLTMVLAQEKPDVLCLLGDPWIVAQKYLPAIKEAKFPLARAAAYMPVDSPVLNRKDYQELGALGCAIWYGEFGKNEAEQAGFTGRSAVIPHGVDLEIYRPVDKAEARAKNIPGVGDAFVVGYVGRNQIRKRLDLAIQHFAQWQQATKSDSYLWLHCDPRDPNGIDVRAVADYFGIGSRLILNSNVRSTMGVVETDMASIYSCFDLHINTASAEGFCLPVIEAMACGVPNLIPCWGGLEWAKDAAVMVPCTGIFATPYAMQGIVDREAFITALDQYYQDPLLRNRMRAAGLALVSEDRFRWESVAQEFDMVFRSLL
jgi:D-inositol-3-phosphate glycosyltransferase